MAGETRAEVYTPEETAAFDERVKQTQYEILEQLEAEGRVRPFDSEEKRAEAAGRIGDIIEKEFATKEFPEPEVEAAAKEGA